jgi:hypothetical protein
MTTTNSTGALKVTASGDREIIFTRAFDAPVDWSSTCPGTRGSA